MTRHGFSERPSLHLRAALLNAPVAVSVIV
jgi:hypothetical protein